MWSLRPATRSQFTQQRRTVSFSRGKAVNLRLLGQERRGNLVPLNLSHNKVKIRRALKVYLVASSRHLRSDHYASVMPSEPACLLMIFMTDCKKHAVRIRKSVSSPDPKHNQSRLLTHRLPIFSICSVFSCAGRERRHRLEVIPLIRLWPNMPQS